VSGYKKVILTAEEAAEYSECANIEIVINDILCAKCRLIKYRSTHSASTLAATGEECGESVCDELAPMEEYASSPSSDDSDYVGKSVPAEEYIEIPLRRTLATHRYCIICYEKNNIHRISLETRLKVFATKQIFIPQGTRCCSSHLLGNSLYADDLSRLRIISDTSRLTKSEIGLFLETVAARSEAPGMCNQGTMDMSEEQVHTLTGHSWENIRDLRQLLTSMRDSSKRSVTQAVIVFLFKLRTGLSNAIIASILGIGTEDYIAGLFAEVMSGFERDIAPSFSGFPAVSRQVLLQNTSAIATALLDLHEDQLVLIFDGTYIRHQKSRNNWYQRKSYSGQKKSHLVKPFTICTTNGYIVDFAGPFYGNQNDATIVKHLLEDPAGIGSILQKDDYVIVDRGFRDAVEALSEKGYHVLMPVCKGKKPQLSSEEANISRKVTKMRWVIEAVHGAIAQKYKLLHHSLHNSLLPRVGVLCKIVAFLHNRYGKRLASDGDSWMAVIDYLKSRMDVANTLSEEVVEQRWNRQKSKLHQLSSTELLDFPQLSEDALKLLFTGSYQFSQAVSYLAELMDADGNIAVQYVLATPTILKAEVRSRHIQSKMYRVYLDYLPYGNDHRSIRRYCCDCPNGNRTAGCCSHVAAVIFYLSYGQYQSRIFQPAAILSTVFDKEQVHVVINDDSDED